MKSAWVWKSITAVCCVLTMFVMYKLAQSEVCNMRLPDDDPGFCKDPFLRCENIFAQGRCDTGEDPASPVRTCPNEGDADDHCEALAEVICYLVLDCRWDNDPYPGQPRCSPAEAIEMHTTTERGSKPCVPPHT